jgi:hypothetical protein
VTNWSLLDYKFVSSTFLYQSIPIIHNINMASTTSLLFCILASHLYVNVFATEPQVLLKYPIENAKCLARCIKAEHTEERTLCFKICNLAQESPETDICKFPRFCTGGCKIACEKQTENISVLKFVSFSASKCEIS